MSDTVPFSSKHFRLEKLAEGVYAALHCPGGWAISNAGIVDLGDRTLVFDAFLTPAAARDLNQAALALTGKPASLVVNSHYHNDHILGNQAFDPQAHIIATERTRLDMLMDSLEDHEEDYRAISARVKALEQEMNTQVDERRRRELSLWVDYYHGISATLPELSLRLPDLTFSQALAFHGPLRMVELLSFSGGHTRSDCVLVLPDDGIAFLGDLLFVGCHPFLSDGDPGALMEILRQVRALGMQRYVPGHGRVGDVADVEAVEDYLQTLQDLARQKVAEGALDEQLVQVETPLVYTDWEMPMFFAANLQMAMQRLGRDPEA